MPRPLHRLLITLRRLTILNIPLQPLPPLPQRPQLPLQNKRNRKVHLNIRNTKLIPKQELPAALPQLRRHEVQIRLNVLRQSDFGLLGVAGLLVPAGVHDRDAVQREGAFGGVHPLEGCVALGVAEGWEEAVGGVVRVAEVSLKSHRLAYISQRLGGCFVRLTLRCFRSR
jgi:hypothetical protein